MFQQKPIAGQQSSLKVKQGRSTLQTKPKKQKQNKKTQVLISGMVVFHKLWGKSIIFLIFHNEILTIETAVSSAKFVKQPFSQALGVVPHVFC